jgi:hypothetical protein
MARQHHDICRVEVARTGAGAPVRFRWSGRSYQVAEVLATWVEAGPWWQRGAQVRGPGAAATGALPMERQVWRVAAGSRFQSEVTGTYDLVHESGSGRWWLTRVWD